ncbi:MAG: penicillin-binding protein 2 [Gemmatimonadota bacterium]
MDGATHRLRRRRGRAARAAMVVVLGILVADFLRMQVLRRSDYVLRSRENQLRAIRIPAARGTIYDRNGRVVAENVPGYVISILPGRSDTVRATLRRLAPYLGLEAEAQARLLERQRRLPNRPLVVTDNATFEQVSAVEERRPAFRRVVVEMRPRRRYAGGRAVAHLIGYVGEISEAELESPRYAGYEPGRTIGKDGVEREYERRLAGRQGVRYVEVNALGSIVRELGPRPAIAAEPGEDLELGIDLGLQSYADSIFPDSMRGGVVALDPSDGEVLLLYSHPTFDPNLFVGGIPAPVWSSLRDDPDKPLLNRVTGATYSPGSTWKLVVATLAMREGIVGLHSYMPRACNGALAYGNRLFRCWRPEGHGSLDLSGAIKESCNVYFYQLGERLGMETMTGGPASLGYTEPTGIDLPHESRGLFPTSAAWYDRRYGRRGWTESVLLNLAIGQGENQLTLLRQALFYSALATGEAPVLPHLARNELLAARRANWKLELPEARRRELVSALVRVVNEPGGTAAGYALDRWTLAGKTGTAQNPHGPPHSWFVGFAPAENPRIVVAAIVEFGHPDNTISLAVPLASRLVDRYLESSGVPPDRQATSVATAPASPRSSPGPEGRR